MYHSYFRLMSCVLTFLIIGQNSVFSCCFIWMWNFSPHTKIKEHIATI